MNTMLNTQPFQSIRDAHLTTGLSEWYLRNGVRNGTIEHVRIGSKYFVNVIALLRKLNALPDDKPQQKD